MFNFVRLKKSFKFAINGLKMIFSKEQNFRIHFAVAAGVVAFGLILKIKSWEWVAVILVIFFVLLLEIVNTIVERIMDMLKPRVNIYVKEAKDLMSAAVLLAAILSIVIGLIIFIPHIKNLFY
ncbi:MAG: diacylglycerol kinase family protein [Patescibacteria group bacterium]